MNAEQLNAGADGVVTVAPAAGCAPIRGPHIAVEIEQPDGTTAGIVLHAGQARKLAAMLHRAAAVEL